MSTSAAPKITSTVMIQEHALTDPDATPVRDPWAGWSKVLDLPEPSRDDVGERDTQGGEPEPESEPVAVAEEPEVDDPEEDDVAAAISRLADEIAKERDLRRASEGRLQAAEAEVARVGAELAAAHGRIAELERDRDEVIRRAEELLTAVRERADQRLAAQLEVARRHWSDLLVEERRRVEALDAERAVLAQQVHDAWLAAAVLRRSRPLRQRSSAPTTVDAAEREVVEDLDENETDPAFVAESPAVAEEIERLRQRLRARRHKPPGIDAVDDGVDQLRESRLARDAAPKARRRR
jgi:hypothetical protein